MSELKAYGMDDPEVGDEYEMYKVSDVDKVLARHKYKRCMAMAMYCYESAMWLEEYGVTKSATFMLRWQKRWLEIAEQFKEAK